MIFPTQNILSTLRLYTAIWQQPAEKDKKFENFVFYFQRFRCST